MDAMLGCESVRAPEQPRNFRAMDGQPNWPKTRPFSLVMAVGTVATAWCLATLAFVVVWCTAKGLTFVGPYSALFGNDELRYLAWIREAGLHGLIADPYRAGAPQVYLQPVFLISGLLWRAGLSIQLSYLVWTPLALVTLAYGYARFTGRFLAGREHAAAFALSLLYFSPLVPLFDYGGIVNANGANDLVIAASHGASYWQAWGFLPTVIALGLMPLFLLGVEAMISGDPDRLAVIGTSLAGLVVAWLHPWGGLELILVTAGVIILRRIPIRANQLVIPALAVAGPLVYYEILSRVDPAWSLSLLRSGTGGPVWPLVIAYLPLLLLAFLALRPPRTPGEQLLGLWLAAAALAYLALPDSRDAALEGISLPLAILAVSGWRRLKLSPRVAWVAVALAVLPGAAYSADTFWDYFRSHDVPFGLRRGEQQAMLSLQRVRANVLATAYLAPALPAITSFVGRPLSIPPFLLDAPVSTSAAQRFLTSANIRAVILDCVSSHQDLAGVIPRVGLARQNFGCARVFRRTSRSVG